MIESLFDIPKMDCPSEEQIIRLALEPLLTIKSMEFDLIGRTLRVTHYGEAEEILKPLSRLNLDAKLAESRELVDAEVGINQGSSTGNNAERWALQIAFGVNAIMFLAELIFGLVGQSTGLIADSLDMFADAAVFALSLSSVGRSDASKKFTAKISGLLQLILGIGTLAEVFRHCFVGSEPNAPYMISIAAVALFANGYCMWILSRHRRGGLHLRASWIFLSNDVIANAGVILAGILVTITSSQLPDLLIGTIIALIVIRGSLIILKLSKRED